MDIVSGLPIFMLLFVAAYIVYILYYAIDLYLLTPSKGKIALTSPEVKIISKNLPAYNLLTKEQQEKFRKRVTQFRANKKFIFSVESSKNEDIKLLLAATATLLTLGYRDYRIASIEKILIYPTAYFSKITKQDHLGEYNPRLKLLVFSAEHILSGFDNATDNLNLGVHEFAHALIFNFKNRFTPNGLAFNKGLEKMNRLLKSPEFLKRIEETAYFREYGTTNIYEFFAVTLENYVETPSDFVDVFPELFETITKMLNYKNFDFHKA